MAEGLLGLGDDTEFDGAFEVERGDDAEGEDLDDVAVGCCEEGEVP